MKGGLTNLKKVSEENKKISITSALRPQILAEVTQFAANNELSISQVVALALKEYLYDKD